MFTRSEDHDEPGRPDASATDPTQPQPDELVLGAAGDAAVDRMLARGQAAYATSRVLDGTPAVAEALDYKEAGRAEVELIEPGKRDIKNI